MNRKKLLDTLVDIGKDILVAFVIVAIIMLVLFAYCRIWPPMVVVESGSMQRYDDVSVVGVIDTGDMVFVKKIGGTDELTTYVDGEATDYSKYGTYGDVIIYRPNGLTVRPDGSKVIPIIHRLVVWIDINATQVNPDLDRIDFGNYTFDVPSLNLYGTTNDIILSDYGFWRENVVIDLEGLLYYYEHMDKVPHGGYITMGDHNVPAYDQPLSGSYEPILPEWIVGKAWGEIPWFGLVKLKVTGANLDGVPGNSWTWLIVTLVIVLSVPLLLDILVPRLKKKAKPDEAEPVDPAPGQDISPVEGSVGPPPEQAPPPESPGPETDK